MAPDLKSISVESDSGELFLLCTLRFHLNKDLKIPVQQETTGSTSYSVELLQKELQRALSNNVTDTVADSKGLKQEVLSSPDDQNDVKMNVDKDIQANQDSEMETSSSVSSVVVGVAEQLNHWQQTVLPMSFAGKNLSSSSLIVQHSDLECSAGKEEVQNNMSKEESKALTSSLTGKQLANISEYTTSSCEHTKRDDIHTCDLNQHRRKTEALAVPAQYNCVDFKNQNSTEVMDSVSLQSSLTSFIDLIESFGVRDMNTPVNMSPSNRDFSNSYRDFSRYNSSSSSSTTSELESSFEDLVRDLDTDIVHNGSTEMHGRTFELHSSNSSDDIIDFQTLYATLSDPIEDCSTETIQQILQDEENLMKTVKEADFLQYDTEGIQKTPDHTLSCLHWVGVENQLYKDLPSLGEEFEGFKKKAGPRKRPNQCYHLWDFLRDGLDKENDYMEWVSKERREFRILDTKRIACAWGDKKRSRNMNYDKLSRSLRYYCKLNILQKVPGKRLHFKFGDGKMWSKV